MDISAKTDYAVRALLELAAREPSLVKVDAIIAEQQLPRKFVEAILGELRRAGLVRSQRGADGGYALALPASEITLGSVIRAVDGPLAEVRAELRASDTEPWVQLTRGQAELLALRPGDTVWLRPARDAATLAAS